MFPIVLSQTIKQVLIYAYSMPILGFIIETPGLPCI